MAFILKKPYQQSKGIIVFRSTEHKFFKSKLPWMQKAVQALTDQYVLGTNWTCYRDNVQDVPSLVFHLAGKTTISLAQGAKTFWIPYGDRNFIPDIFRPNAQQEPHWDIICISNAIKIKRLDEFLKTLRLVYDQRPHTKVLMVCPEDSDEVMRRAKKSWYTELPEDFSRLFSEQEQANIDLLRLKRYKQLYPITPSTMAFLYQSSRVFALFTNQEGGSRVISEALLSGLPVVAKRHLLGGGLDYLNEDNSRLFTTIEEAAEHFIALLDSSRQSYAQDAVTQELCADYTIPKLEQYFRLLFEQLGEPFEGPWDQSDLFMKLPGHANLLPSNMVDLSTKVDELGFYSNFLKFTDYACGTNLYPQHRFPAFVQDCRIKCAKQLNRFYWGRKINKLFSAAP